MHFHINIALKIIRKLERKLKQTCRAILNSSNIFINICDHFYAFIFAFKLSFEVWGLIIYWVPSSSHNCNIKDKTTSYWLKMSARFCSCSFMLLACILQPYETVHFAHANHCLLHVYNYKVQLFKRAVPKFASNSMLHITRSVFHST